MDGITFSIGKAAAASGLTAKTVRYYEKIGLIPHARRGNSTARTGGNRIYRDVDVDRLRFIRHTRMLDLGLDDIADLLALAENGCPGRQPEYRETLDRHLHTVERRIQHLLGLRAAIRQLLAREGASCGDEHVRTSCGCMEISCFASSKSRLMRTALANTAGSKAIRGG
jgi:DNA-binding transcriptional MerR regulator